MRAEEKLFQKQASFKGEEMNFQVKIEQDEEIFDPNQLKKAYEKNVPGLIQKKKQKRNNKNQNAFQYMLKVFFDNMPNFPDQKHVQRLLRFLKKPEKQKSRFQLVQLFGVKPENPRENIQNELNRRVLKRALIKNYDNILVNKHISNKRLYLLFCKKMMMRLNKPEYINNLKY